MGQYKNLLVTAFEVVTFLFSSQEGFLKAIAPPEEANASYLVGIVSFLVLIILLIVSAIARSAPGQQFRRWWIAAGVLCAFLALPAALFYPGDLEKYTWRDAQHVPHLQGSESGLTGSGRDYLARQSDKRYSPERLLSGFPGPDEIWTRESLAEAGKKLRNVYAWLVTALAASIFCLLEANSSSPTRNRRKPARSVGEVMPNNR